jgi:hypothetical protein
MRAATPAVGDVQCEALKRVEEFMASAMGTDDARDAANWSLAAKNAASVAVSCETLLKVRGEAERRR